MQKVRKKVATVRVRFSKRELEKIDEAVTQVGAKSRNAFIRDAIERHVQEVRGLKGHRNEKRRQSKSDQNGDSRLLERAQGG